MALLEILKYPDPRLRIKAQPVVSIDDELRRIAEDMYETMYDSCGVGLAGTQVNIHQRIFTMDVSEARDQRICVLNPEILHKEGIQYEAEGCLSVGGGAYDKVERALKVRLRGMDLDGKTFEIEAEGLMAVCIQHEIDHLNGILFIDHLSRLKQDRIRKKIVKSERRE
ncbi:Peptide deformylase [Aquicella siphonis]|uniref:Peptide deformylase n=1 Tax=Aquicella siphonis TaxID=254247 RepID=A0A5E4PEI6_9COXI|nr:peptide deformylase [Aquicella siphonis]VVC74823.1 Peptide deformylase [Aquicella siphonis]